MILNKENSSRFINDILKNEPVKASELSDKLGCNKSYISNIKAGKLSLSEKYFDLILKLYPEFNKYVSNNTVPYMDNLINLKMFDNSYLTPDYLKNRTDHRIIKIDKKLLNINYPVSNTSEFDIVRISNNAFEPAYKLNDNIVIDLSVTSFTNGMVFAFVMDNEICIYEISKFNDKIECLDVNNKNRRFYLESDVKIIGAIVPNVRF